MEMAFLGNGDRTPRPKRVCALPIRTSDSDPAASSRDYVLPSILTGKLARFAPEERMEAQAVSAGSQRHLHPSPARRRNVVIRDCKWRPLERGEIVTVSLSGQRCHGLPISRSLAWLSESRLARPPFSASASCLAWRLRGLSFRSCRGPRRGPRHGLRGATGESLRPWEREGEHPLTSVMRRVVAVSSEALLRP